jgi:hypothetical protein
MKQVLGVDIQATVVKEPVLDVPAIDMTEAAATSQKAEAGKKGAKRARPNRKQPAPTARAKMEPNRARGGSVGRETFERVEALVKQGKNKSEAFKQIAADTGKNVGTVAANYYRVARPSGAVKPRKALAPERATRGRKKAAQTGRQTRSVRSGNSAGGVEQIVGQLAATVAALTEAVKDQDVEVRELRGRLDGVRNLLG